MLKKAFSWVVYVQLCIADFGKMLYSYTGCFRKNLLLVKTKLFKNQKFDGLFRNFRKHRKNFNLGNMNHINVTKIIQ